MLIVILEAIKSFFTESMQTNMHPSFLRFSLNAYVYIVYVTPIVMPSTICAYFD